MALTQVSTGGIKNATIKNEDIEADTVQLTKLQNMATNHILGRSTSGTGNPEILGAAQVRSILNVADGATNSTTTTINSNADNRVITGSGTADTLNAEANLTFDGSKLAISNTSSTDANNTVNGVGFTSGTFHHRSKGNNAGISGQTYSNQLISSNGTNVALELYTIGGTGTPIVFGTDSTERMRVDTSGNVGIGTSSPAKKLHVFESGVATIQLETGDSRGQAFNILSTNGAGTNTGTLSIRNEAGQSFIDMSHNGGSPFTKIYNTGSQQFTFDSDGLKFGSDTAAANALDDYEEGTFSATASAAGYSGGSAISMSGEQYTKIGRLVFFRMHLTVASSLSDGDLSISGLPFTASKDSVVNFAWQDAASFNGGQGIITGTQCVRFNGVFPTHHTGNATIRFSGTYNI